MTPEAAPEQEYVLGTHDEEVARLGLQHRVWRPRALAAWQSAEIGAGETVLDIGSGPGYASQDLAEVVGPSGRVIAIDKSARFLEIVHTMSRQRGFENVFTYKADFNNGEFPEVIADCAWCRWVFAFVKDPQNLLARIAAALRPEGTIVLHEYFDYSTWRSLPRCTELEEMVSAVMRSWRDNGGEPDIALSLPGWLEELGFELKRVRPMVDVVQRNHMVWSWLRAFIEASRRRLVELAYLSAERAEAIWETFSRFEETPGTWMITPGVLEIVASRGSNRV